MLLAGCLLLAGCGAQFLYNRLDTVAWLYVKTPVFSSQPLSDL